MSEEQHLHDSEDDTSDEEYVPGGEDCAQLSEVESDGEPENDVNSDNESNNKQKKRKGKTKRKNSKKQKIVEAIEEEEEENTKELTEEEQKKKTDSLWADFLKDTDFKPKPKTENTENTSIVDNKQTQPVKKLEKDKPVEIEKEKETKPIFFEFAGEKLDSDGNVIEKKEIKPQAPTISRKSGGLGSVLNQIGKKQKISTLEKSKLDWNKFKKEEDIEDELKSHNMGKNGYLDRQDFLQRTDLRQFELEKEARATKRTHRS